MTARSAVLQALAAASRRRALLFCAVLFAALVAVAAFRAFRAFR
jgi:hypothetical protein